MDGLIIGFIFGYLVRLFIAVCFDEYQTNKEFRKAKIEVDLNRCCDNAYNYGYMKGQFETEIKYRKKLDDLIERYTKPTGEKVETMDWIKVNERYKAPDSMFKCSKCGEYHYVNDNYCPGCGRKYKPKGGTE